MDDDGTWNFNRCDYWQPGWAPLMSFINRTGLSNIGVNQGIFWQNRYNGVIVGENNSSFIPGSANRNYNTLCEDKYGLSWS